MLELCIIEDDERVLSAELEDDGGEGGGGGAHHELADGGRADEEDFVDAAGDERAARLGHARHHLDQFGIVAATGQNLAEHLLDATGAERGELGNFDERAVSGHERRCHR